MSNTKLFWPREECLHGKRSILFRNEPFVVNWKGNTRLGKGKFVNHINVIDMKILIHILHFRKDSSHYPRFCALVALFVL